MDKPHSLPAWVEPLCRRFYPSRYRIVWSEDVFDIFFGERQHRYGTGRDRWMIEKWFPPPPREQWDETAEGPYPNEGTWEHSFTFETVVNEGEEPTFVPLEEQLADLWIRAVEAGKLRHSSNDRKAALEARQKAIEDERKKRFDDMWDDAKPAVHAKIPEHIQLMDSYSSRVKSVEDLPARFRNKRPGKLSVRSIE